MSHASKGGSPERDYVLGTHDEEVDRLGVQHEAWLSLAAACWKRGGVRRGQRVIDVGAGPGYAAFDLARRVGRRGHVTAVERSSRFIEAGRAGAAARGLGNIEFVERDLMADELPGGDYDAAWCRWVASFVGSPEELVEKVASVVRPGGSVMFHEYVDYASWRFSPTRPRTEDYIRRVMEGWRAAGGEPDVAMRIPPVLSRKAFVLERVEPIVRAVRPGDPLWRWISTFIGSNVDRQVELGALSVAEADAVSREFATAEQDSRTIMLTPMVLEIVARRPDRTVVVRDCCTAPRMGGS